MQYIATSVTVAAMSLPQSPEDRVPIDAKGRVQKGLLDRFLTTLFRRAATGEVFRGSVLIVELFSNERSVGIIGPELPDAVESVLLGPWLMQERKLAWSAEVVAVGAYRDSGAQAPPLVAEGYEVGHA